MKIVIVGAGFVGLTTACVLADRGHNIVLIDQDQEKISMIAAGTTPFYENGLSELLRQVIQSGHLVTSTWQTAKLDSVDFVMLCVGTPSGTDGSIDLKFVRGALEKCAEHLSGNEVIAIKSTIIPGTTRKLQAEILATGSQFRLAMVPEFLREGSALSDAKSPDRVIIGAHESEVGELLRSAFEVTGSETIITSTFSAEAIKYFSNVFLAACISLTNELFELVNTDKDCVIPDILSGWHSDRRFKGGNGNPAGITKYLVPGPGFGGSCFPKDVSALHSHMKNQGIKSEILSAVLDRNSRMAKLTSDWIADNVPKDQEILMMGVAFKEETDDIRDSPAMALLYELKRSGYLVEWLDKRIPSDLENLPANRISGLDESQAKYVVLTNHEESYLRDLALISKGGTELCLTVFALRLQEPVPGHRWLFPRQGDF